jgi:hypothetical protein
VRRRTYARMLTGEAIKGFSAEIANRNVNPQYIATPGADRRRRKIGPQERRGPTTGNAPEAGQLAYLNS